MMNKREYGLIFLLTIFMSCKHKPEPIETPCTLPGTVSFSQHIIPLFNAHCNTEGCHSGSEPQGGLNLEPDQAYAELTQPGKGYIDTINPPYSLLYSQMISVSTPMPPTGNLPKCSSDLVLRWIEQKAPNN